MDENVYRSPEEVDERGGGRPGWQEEREQMQSVAFGLGLSFWGSIVAIAGSVLAIILTDTGDSKGAMEMASFAGSLPGSLVGLAGAFYCMRCPENVVEGAKRLILFSIFFYILEVAVLSDNAWLKALGYIFCALGIACWCLFLWRLAESLRNAACMWRVIYAMGLGVGFCVMTIIALPGENMPHSPLALVAGMASLAAGLMAIVYIVLELVAMRGLQKTINRNLSP